MCRWIDNRVVYGCEGCEINSDLASVNGSLQQCFTSASNGKALVAAAISGKGVWTAADSTYQQMANNIGAIKINTAPESMYFNLGGNIENNGGYKGELHFTIYLYNMYIKITKSTDYFNGHLLVYNSAGILMETINCHDISTHTYASPVHHVSWQSTGGGLWDCSFTAHN